MRGIEETGGLTEKFGIGPVYRRFGAKQIRRKTKVYTSELQSKLVSGGKLGELV
jgi:hypothetical protein